MERFSIEARACAPQSQTVALPNGRITVLTPWMIRVEHGALCDAPTQGIWYRDIGQTAFTTRSEGMCLVVDTGEVCFYYHRIFHKITCIRFRDGRCVRNFTKGNLRGTCRTLDMTNGATHLERGLVSRSGVAVYDDSKSLVLQGEKLIARDKCSDLYYFAYGHQYRMAIRDLYRIAGETPLIPRFALGNWWSRYKAYTQQEYQDLMQRFLDEKIPVTVATIDMDWHWVNVIERFGKEARPIPTDNKLDRIIWSGNAGWTGYSWNTDLFPDYRGLLKWLQDNKFVITLNVHPSHGVRFFEDMYEDMCRAVGQDPAKKQQVQFRAGDITFWRAYFDVLHHPYEKDGVRFWWIDWQQGKHSEVKGLDPLWALNHYHTLDQRESGKRPLILSRYAGVGSHRYPLGFSGDTAMTWRTLDFQPYMTANAANVGYSWWSHDIGGHHMGYQDEELYLRWIQLGVFSPINRLHSTSNEFMGKEPWKRSHAAHDIAVDYLRLRHKLIPYLYAMNDLTHRTGRALCEPLYYTWDTPEAYRMRNMYRFGTQLLVAPITRPDDRTCNAGYTKVWIPIDGCTDIFTGYRYRAGEYTVCRDLSQIPVFALPGAILPMYADAESNNISNVQDMEIRLYCGDGNFVLYEDDGDTMAYRDGACVRREMTQTWDGNTATFRIAAAQGVADGTRKLHIRFCDLTGGVVYVNGQKTSYSPDAIVARDDGGEIVIAVRNTAQTPAPDYRESVIELVSKFQMGNARKKRLYSACLDSMSVKPRGPKTCALAIAELQAIGRRENE